MPDTEYKYIGRGIYTVPEISLYTKIPKHTIHDWIKVKKSSEPLIVADFGKENGIYCLSFKDLIEAKMIRSLREKGVSLQAIRKAHARLRVEFALGHPFATNRFLTDGKGIWIDVGKEEKDDKLINVLNDQIELGKIICTFLSPIDYSDDGNSLRWWPMERKCDVVIDPLRSFGQPIVNEASIPTYVLASAYKAEQSFEKVAWWYDISIESVKRALIFETTFTNRIAA